MSCSSEGLYEKATHVLPGGVNSPVRAFGAVGGRPRFIKSADGCFVTDVEGLRYIDYVASWGPMILGHNHPKVLEAVLEAATHGLSFGAPCPAEVDVAALMCAMVPGLEMVRMVNSGTEAVMSALRLARGATGRDKIIKFEGCYHGHVDSMLVRAGSGIMTAGVPDSSGVSKAQAGDTLLASYNDLDSVEALLALHRDDVAAIIVEPVAANMGVIEPQPGFLEGLRRLCDTHGCLLVFDEVITGFRLARGGAQEYYGIRADLVVFGKIIGAGMPVGAYGGSRELMGQVAPLGPVYQAGTLSGNPLAMAAGYAQLSVLDGQPQIYTQLKSRGDRLAEGLAEAGGNRVVVQHVGSLVCVFFCKDAVKNYAEAGACDTQAYARYFHLMLEAGVYLAPAQFEAMFVGAAHTDVEIDETVEQARRAFLALDLDRGEQEPRPPSSRSRALD